MSNLDSAFSRPLLQARVGLEGGAVSVQLSPRSQRREGALAPSMPAAKRVFDITVALLLLALLWPLMLVVALLLLLLEGRPVFYVSERMKAPGLPFRLVKFRTMAVGADRNGGVTGGDKAEAILSPLHRILRRTRIDELPQLWNVLRGDMSLVGPRPPLRRYVEAYPEIYDRVLRSRPGVTGLATLLYHEREECLLAACRTPEETEAIYCRVCIPRKARLDLLYQHRWNLWLDLWLVARTALRPIRALLPGPARGR